jgi:hypothetical protein
MKKITVLIVTMVLLSISVIPAFASGGPSGAGQGSQQGGPRGTIALVGEITAIDPVAHTLAVKVIKGNKLVQPYIGQEVEIATTLTTRYLLKAEDGTATLITFADLAVGDEISVNGRVLNNIWTARRITVGPDLNCLP